MASFSLNGELVEVFSRLPAKSIIKFKSVCKDAKSYTSESLFLQKHCENILAKGDSGILVFESFDNVQLFSSNSMKETQYFGVPLESKEFLSRENWIIASSNGLVCGRLKSEPEAPLYICNPVTKSMMFIPLPGDLNLPILVFECFDSKDYMLLLITSDPDNGDWHENKFQIKIYSSEERVWKFGGEFKFGSRNMDIDIKPVYINSGSNGGVVYCMSDSGNYLVKDNPHYWPYVVCYDIGTCITRKLEIPKEAREAVHEDTCKLNIFKWIHSDDHRLGSTVCLIKSINTIFSVWILDQELEWKMIMEKSTCEMGILEPNLTVEGFTVISGNVLVIATEKRLYKYKMCQSSDEKTQEICRYDLNANYCNARPFPITLLPYSSTLRPCGVGAMPLPI